jgi:hypothetical protein
LRLYRLNFERLVEDKPMMKVRTTEFEGTPDEFARVAHLFSGAMVGASTGPSGGKSVEVETSEITSKLVLLVLTRRKLSSDIRKVLKALLQAGANGLTPEEIATAVGINWQKLSGVMGAFGRRVASTPGWPAGVSFIERGSGRRWLPEVVRDVLESGQFKL